MNIREKFTLWCAFHVQRLPYMVAAAIVGKRFDLGVLMPKDDDPLPRRFFWRKVYRPALQEKGQYIYGRAPLTVGRRFAALQAIKAGRNDKAVSVFYRLPCWCMRWGRFDKVGKLSIHVARDLMAREKRDCKLQSPLTDIQRQAGYDKINSGLFGIIDYVATRNGLTYHQVEDLSDATLYAIMKIDHDKAAVRRREMELQTSKWKTRKR